MSVDQPVDIDALQHLLKTERKRRGLSLRAASDEAEVPFNTLSRVERGYLPDLANFRRIVEWLGIPPERFFQPTQLRAESTPDAIAQHLARDPNLSPAAAERISALVEELYSSLALRKPGVRVHLRAASTFEPRAATLLTDLLEEMQSQLFKRNNRSK